MFKIAGKIGRKLEVVENRFPINVYIHLSITIYDFRLQLIITAILPIKVLFFYKPFQQDKIIYIFNMIKNIALLVCTFALIGSYFVLRDNNEKIDFKGTEYFGNMSDVMKLQVKHAIELSTYKYEEIDDMSQYIGNTLDNLYGPSWQIYIFSHGCDMTTGVSTTKYYNRWARFENYSKQNFCYYIFQTTICRATISPSFSLSQPNGEMWGSGFSYNQRIRILGLVQEASDRSMDPFSNAKYILDRLGTGYWAVTLGNPKNSQFASFACAVNQYWALLWDKGAYNWFIIGATLQTNTND